MKKSFKRAVAAVSAVSVIAFGGLSASAATKEDVIAAARSAGFLEVYVQQLSNFLASNNFSSDQYDIMIGALGNIESYGDEIALQYFGKTLDEMRGQAEEEADKKNESNKGDNKFDVPASDSWAAQVVDKMTNDQLIKSLNEIVNTGKQLGLDITVEQNGDKNFIMTVKDSKGNVQLVTPIGKVVATTGAEAEVDESDLGIESVAALCASVLAAGGIGAWLLGRKNRKAGE